MRIRSSVLVDFFKDPLRAHFSVRSAVLNCNRHVFLSNISPAWTSRIDRELLRVLSDDFKDREACECDMGILTDQKHPSNVRRHGPKPL